MATPPAKKQLTMEDVPGAPGWVEKLLGAINAFTRPTAEALDRGLTYAQNFTGQVVDVVVTPPDDWATPTLETGWAATGAAPDPQPFSLRKTESGDVQVRGRLDWTAGGVPVAGQVIANLGSAYASARREVFDAFATDGAIYKPATLAIDSTGALTWSAASGGYRSISVSGDTWWTANDRTPPRWTAPVDVKLGAAQRPFPGRAGSVQVLRATRRDSPALPAVVTSVDWEPINLEKSKNAPGVRLHRVWGLSPGVAYSLRLLILPE